MTRIEEHDTRAAWRIAVACVLVFGLLQLILGAAAPLDGDEVYYWDWSRRLAPGYFDHPPAIAALIRAGVMLAGNTSLGVRLMAVIANVLGALLILQMCRRLGDSWAPLRAALALACMPMISWWLLLATPDNPLFAANAAGLLAVERATAEPAGSRRSLGWWALGGMATGLALQSKEMGILLPLGVLAALLLHPGLRPQLRSAGPYLAALLAALIVSPVVIWNLQNDSPFRFHLRKGLGAGGRSPLDQEVQYVAGLIGMGGIILFGLMMTAVGRALRTGRDTSRFLLAMICLTTLAFFGLSAIRKPVEANWPGPAFTPGILLLATAVGGVTWRRWFRAGLLVGALVTVLIWVDWLHPILPFPPDGDPFRRGHGWSSIAERVDAERARLEQKGRGQVWVAGNRFQDASWLAFYLPDHPTVFSPNINDRSNQYAWWPGFEKLARPGDDLVILLQEGARDPGAVAELAPHFRSWRKGELVEPTAAGWESQVRRIWVLEGWKGTWPVIERRP